MSMVHTVYVGPYVRTPVEGELSWGDFVRKYGEGLMPTEPIAGLVRCWLPNFAGSPGRQFDRHTQSAVEDLDAGVQHTECEQFHRQYAAQIAALRENYGEENVHVRWGVVSYFM